SDFLEKPFVPEDLRMSIESVLRSDPAADSHEVPHGYKAVLQHVREALRAGKFAEAEHELMKAGTITGEDAAFLNLAGVLQECHGRRVAPSGFSARPFAPDRRYLPAQENLTRLAEIHRYGKSIRRFAFGDVAASPRGRRRWHR